MKTSLDLALDLVVDQAVFASAVGISEARVSQLVADGLLRKGEPARAWLRAYCERLREQAAGRGQELTIERAGLARAQRLAQERKNAVDEGLYAEVGLLADVLAAASAGVADRLDALPALLRKTCPDLPVAARDTVQRVVAEARNAWIRDTAELVVRRLDEIAATEADPIVGPDEAQAAAEQEAP